MTSSSTSPITDQHRQQYIDEGYFILERVIPDDHLQIMRDSCDLLIDLMHQEMDRLGTRIIFISAIGVSDTTSPKSMTRLPD